MYVNGKTAREAFDAKLEFDVKIISYEGETSWVEPTLLTIKKCLDSDAVPEPAADCDYCTYRKAAAEVSSAAIAKGKTPTLRKAQPVESTETASLF